METRRINSKIKAFAKLPPRQRTKLIVPYTTIGSLLLALGKILLGIFSLSIFIIVSAIHSIGIAICKVIYLFGAKRAGGDNTKERPYLFLIGVVLLVSSIFYIIYMIRLFFIDSTFRFGNIMAISIAAVSFTELTVAIVGLTKTRKNKDLLLGGLKTVNLSSAFVAIVLTQAALLHTTNNTLLTPKSLSRYNAITGIVFGSINVVLSLIIISYIIRTERITPRQQAATILCPVCDSVNFLNRSKCIVCQNDLKTAKRIAENFDYMSVRATINTSSEITNYYKKLHYIRDGNREIFGTNGVMLYFKRLKAVENKDQIQALEKEVTPRVAHIVKLERRIVIRPFITVFGLGFFGILVIISGIILAILSSTTIILTAGIITTIVGLIIVGGSYPFFITLQRQTINDISPLIAEEKLYINELLNM